PNRIPGQSWTDLHGCWGKLRGRTHYTQVGPFAEFLLRLSRCRHFDGFVAESHLGGNPFFPRSFSRGTEQEVISLTNQDFAPVRPHKDTRCAGTPGSPAPAGQYVCREAVRIPVPQRGSMFVEIPGPFPLPQRGSMLVEASLACPACPG